MMALMGDAIDNVPGVRGVGEKTAIELVKQFGTLEELYARIDEVKGARRKALEAGREDAFLSRRLVTLDPEVPFGASLDELRPREPDTAAALAIFREMEFSRLVRELGAGAAASAAASAGGEAERTTGRTPRAPRATTGWSSRARSWPPSCACCAARAASPSTWRRRAWSRCAPTSSASRSRRRRTRPGTSRSGTATSARRRSCRCDEVLDALGPLLVDPALPKYGQNIKYDALVLARAGIELAGIGFDTMVASYVINPTRHQHNLAELALEYLGEQVTTYKDVAGSGKKQISFAEVEVEKARDYSGEDADVAFRLTQLLAPKLEELGFHALFYDLELPLVAVLARMERNGVCIDSQRLRDGSKEADIQLQELMRRIWAIAGVEFNINSPKQLGEILFDKLGLPVVRRTKTGRSTDEDVLTRLAASHELPAEILAWRSLAKLKNTYLDVLPTLVNPETGRVHTSFNQTVTATGRLSSSDPNLQNIPVRTELGRRIRESFTAAPGSILVSADYSQIELRIMAHLSGDAELCDAFRRGEDIHARTAALMFGLRRGRGDRRAAARRQGDQLRDHLRHGRLRALAAAGDRPEAGEGVHRALLRALPGRARLARPDDRGGETHRVRRDAARAAALPAGDRRRRTAASRSSPSAWRSTRRCRARRPT